MSIDTDHRAQLLAYAPLAAALPDTRQFAISAIAQGTPTPYIAMTSSTTHERGLDDGLLGRVTQIDYQCWADTAIGAANIADILVDAIMSATDAVVLTVNDGYDEETQRDCVAVTAQLLMA